MRHGALGERSGQRAGLATGSRRGDDGSSSRWGGGGLQVHVLAFGLDFAGAGAMVCFGRSCYACYLMAERSRVVCGILAVSVGAALIPACGDNVIEAQIRALGEGCLLDSECDGDLVCVFRRCHVECETTADCRARDLETICVLGDRPTNVCLLPDEAECETVAECPSSLLLCA